MKKQIIFLLLILNACVEPEKPPTGILNQAQMVDILIDIHVAEAKVNQLSLRSYDSMRTVYDDYEQDIYRKFGIDSTIYNRSYDYYLRNPAMMDEIYTAVVDSLSLWENLGKTE